MPRDNDDDDDDGDDNDKKTTKTSSSSTSSSISSILQSITSSIPFLKSKNIIQSALKLLTDNDGKLLKLFHDNHINSSERKQWILMWLDIDENISNRIKYIDFIDYFNLIDSLWIRRVYEMIDDTGKGITFLNFINFCMKYLIIDFNNINEFSMRLLSRRCSTFQSHVSILDSEDIKFFVSLRYDEFKDQIKKKKIASDIVDYIDRCKDGAIDIGDFISYSNQNPVFLRFSILLQHHFRKCIFGTKYWVNKSRALKKYYAKGFDAFKFANEINYKAEKLCSYAGCPVVDDRGNIIDDNKKLKKAPSKDDDTKEGDTAADSKDDNKADNKENKNEDEEDDLKIVFSDDADGKGDLSKQKDNKVIDKKPYLKFKGTFDAMNVDIRKYEIDFPDVVRAVFERKMMKQAKKKEMMKKANDLVLQQKSKDIEKQKLSEDELNNEARKKEEEETRKKEEEATFHERIKMKTDQLYQLHCSDDHVCETYISNYHNIVHHNNEIIHPNRTRHIMKNIISSKTYEKEEK